MATLLPPLLQPFLDNDGLPLAGGFVYTYAAGTTTPLATHQDADESAQHENPIELDSTGRAPAPIFLGDASYKFVVKDSLGNTINTIDKVAHILTGSISNTDLADDSVSTIKIQNSAVTTAKIDDEAVTNQKLAPDAVDGTKIEDDSIDSEHYVDGSIDNVHLAGGITEAKLAAPRKLQCRKFQTVGDNAITFPADTTYGWANGAGGAGAGGQGGTGSDGNNMGGGGGGGGGASVFTGPYAFNFTAGEAATVRVGAGGASNGADGEASSITAINGTFPSIYFPGAEGGDTGGAGSAGGGPGGPGGNSLINPSSFLNFIHTECGPGGAGGTAGPANLTNEDGNQAPSYALMLGGTIAAGGAGGTTPAVHDNEHGAGGGGGARSIFANGGAGGDGKQNVSGNTPTAGAAGGAMAGGGGGGGGYESGNQAGAAGGAGGRGEVWIWCNTTESWEGTV